MSINNKNLLYFFLSMLLLHQPSFAFFEKIDGLEYNIRKIENAPLEKTIQKNYDLYELYFENKTNKTYSIPGYSIDLGVDYLGLMDIYVLNQNKPSKKSTVFNIAAGAASIVLGGIAKTATNTALRTIGSFKHKNANLANENNFLSVNKTYVVYPGDGLSVFFFVNKLSFQAPNTMRFICHDEEENVNHVVINDDLKFDVYNAKENLEQNSENKKLIVSPNTKQYK